jgi:hypothetical protein
MKILFFLLIFYVTSEIHEVDVFMGTGGVGFGCGALNPGVIFYSFNELATKTICNA